MEQVINGDHITETYWSLAEFADTADKRASRARRNANDADNEYFTHVKSFGEALTLARYGWQEALDSALELAESAVATANQEHMMDTFNPVWDVTGAEVDVARYLSGEPECMIDFPLAKTSKSGKVVTLVASGSISGSISADTIIKRGRVMVALAMALSRLGHAVELWIDFSKLAHSGPAGSYQRVLIKGANDELDPSQVMFAYAHPAMLRVLNFGTADGMPGQWRKAFSEHTGRGIPSQNRDEALYPEGTIYLPALKSTTDIPDADEFLKKYLGELGLLAE
jgi:hypothetical protein